MRSNNLDEPKPSGFDFRRFVLTAEATPNDRLQAYVEIEFERLAEIEVERAVQRFDDGVAFEESNSKAATAGRSRWSRCGASSNSATPSRCASVRSCRRLAVSTSIMTTINGTSRVDARRPERPCVAREVGMDRARYRRPGSKSVGKSGQLRIRVCGQRCHPGLRGRTGGRNRGRPEHPKLAGEAGLTRGPVNGEGGTRAGTWRVGYSPTFTTDFGFSGYIGKYTPDFMDRSRADQRYGVDGLWKHGSLAVEGEYIHTDFGNTDRVVKAFIDTVTGSTGIAPLAGAGGRRPSSLS